MSSLMEKIRALPPKKGRKRSKWKLKYGEAFEALLELGYSKLAAVEWIAEQEGLSKREASNFYRSAVDWNRKGGQA